jgi:hypothetical protein
VEGGGKNIMAWMHDTANCRKRACEHCGAKISLLARAVETPLGVYCTTVCEPCHHAGRDARPITDFGELARRIPAHAEHLSVSPGELVAAAGNLGAQHRPRPTPSSHGRKQTDQRSTRSRSAA